jgi:hypothetical protein
MRHCATKRAIRTAVRFSAIGTPPGPEHPSAAGHPRDGVCRTLTSTSKTHTASTPKTRAVSQLSVSQRLARCDAGRGECLITGVLFTPPSFIVTIVYRLVYRSIVIHDNMSQPLVVPVFGLSAYYRMSDGWEAR